MSFGDYLEEIRRKRWSKKSEKIRRVNLVSHKEHRGWKMVNSGVRGSSVGANSSINQTVDGKMSNLTSAKELFEKE